jgi:hypothetical protein
MKKTIIQIIQAVCYLAIVTGFSMLFRVHQPVGWWENEPPDGIFHREYREQVSQGWIFMALGAACLFIYWRMSKKRSP